MSYKSEIILSQQTHNIDTGPNAYTGERYPGDGFYGKSDGLHTVQYSVTDLVGVLCIQATLEFEPTETDWFTVVELPFDLLEESVNGVENFIGNYVWVRAIIREWEHGTVQVVRLNR